MVAIVSTCIHVFVGAAFASVSNGKHERRIVNAILNQSYSPDYSIEPLIKALNPATALIPEPDFYRSLAMWYRGYQNDDDSIKERGIRDLQKLSKRAESTYADDTPTNQFIVGIIKAYTARALFENEQVIKGYYAGTDAIDRLQKFVLSATPNAAGYHDAKFLLALHSIYTHDLKNRTHWLIGTVKSVGDKNSSVKDIHAAIESNAIFAPESVRSFFAEVQWRTPDICNYRDLAQSSQKTLPNNLDLALLTQGLLLKCGHPRTALEINNRFHSRSDLPESVSKKQLQARLRILVDLGDHEEISALNLPASLRAHQQLALANALDVKMNRNEALKQYQQLVDSAITLTNIKRVATVRITYPYQRPKQIQNTDSLSQLRISQSCQEGQ